MNLNTMDSFSKEGFKIVLDGKEITLTSKEMSEFRYMDRAFAGRCSLDYVLSDEDFKLPEDYKNKLFDNEELCEDITQNIEEVLYEDNGPLEYDVVSTKVKGHVLEQLLEPSKKEFFDVVDQKNLYENGDSFSIKSGENLEVIITVMDEEEYHKNYKKFFIELLENGEIVAFSNPKPYVLNANVLWGQMNDFLYKNFDKVMDVLEEKDLKDGLKQLDYKEELHIDYRKDLGCFIDGIQPNDVDIYDKLENLCGGGQISYKIKKMIEKNEEYRDAVVNKVIDWVKDTRESVSELKDRMEDFNQWYDDEDLERCDYTDALYNCDDVYLDAIEEVLKEKEYALEEDDIER